ncbi:hypothetical protein F503_03011 [Ophiostoma piceae UAMH 11346]|uniref:Uncharacterized protein n=1 Tax=Ophiostoma piceae (strain UAMH 11346) TaxID=1262450 RepID=S3C083_OPHP1|nr:hypothetical protein F503_03011 [Ophiostoma piceae UAMH 11346]
MHPAPSLLEAPPLREEPRQGKGRRMSEESMETDQGRTSSEPSSPHRRPDSSSPTSPTVTNITNGSVMAMTSGGNTRNDQSASSHSTISNGDRTSPTFASQNVFPVNGGSDASTNRRPSRRRTGPLSASQREKAALIRKLGACIDCRRRRVACHPSHHAMSWEEAMRKFMAQSPTQEYTPLAGRPISPAQSTGRLSFGQSDAQEMDIDSDTMPAAARRLLDPQQHHQQEILENQQLTQEPQQQQQQQISQHQEQAQPSPRQAPTQTRSQPSPLPPAASRRLSMGTESRLRTPLPSGPRPEKFSSGSLPGIESLSGDLQSGTARVINEANPSRSRYDFVQVMIVQWSNDSGRDERDAINELSALLKTDYNYNVEIVSIPVGAQSPLRWLMQTVMGFVNNRDMRDTLKIFYYAGFSYLDRDREFVLSSSMDKAAVQGQAQATIRWSAIQQVLEDATADTLLLMDAAYYPCSKMTRREGVFEVVAAASGEDPKKALGRVSFTRAITEELRTRLNQRFRGPLSALSAAELHVQLTSNYPKIIEERSTDKEQMTSFPSPFHMQAASNARLPSILLAPFRKSSLRSPEPTTPIPSTQLNLTIRLSDGVVDKPGWIEWMRLLPEGVKEVKCESPFRNVYR